MRSTHWVLLAMVMGSALGCEEASSSTNTADTGTGVDVGASQDTGSTVDAPVDARTTTAPLYTNACGTCLRAECTDVEATCAADDNCRRCVVDEDHDACHASAESEARANDVFTCQANHCSSQCFTGDGGTADGGLSCTGAFRGACGTCLEGGCCAQVARCRANDVCWRCVTTGNESVCHSEPAGHALAHALWTCVAAECRAECQSSGM